MRKIENNRVGKYILFWSWCLLDYIACVGN